ncbi:MAG: hypothetical protein AAGG44_18785, partial [Planctomycetota bacterium]
KHMMQSRNKQKRFQRLQNLAELQRAQSASKLQTATLRAEALEEELRQIEASYIELIGDAGNSNTENRDAHQAAIAPPDELARKERYREFLEKEKERTLSELNEVQTAVSRARASLEESQVAYQRLDCLNQNANAMRTASDLRSQQRDSDELAARSVNLPERSI